ncbi:hypothetical protein A3O11_05665 [Ligilactobacillus aviarius]|uniref:hypothetical protein n=1 Tax=Ligilactobacillus aviarius TaxID=1606 RepID=UPI0007D9B7DC|nr:hypothetical protein [Ligilactobacillus aviarius]OAQ01688.1 hypothetical protein A3O10_02420 [Ligilactobacillus aviarius]OAQ04311.1 hypothetical protein A3O11_05665 [Ligilactobacillus aviarius]OAS81087.1 hypothetical protein A3O18_00010 [Ligilactobacillus aviarius]PEG71464.1 hypothetical protein A3P04_01170 [Ligilactobacillus aviarius]PEG74374.1 hypothetical protein A3O82_01525 [Ligilactobacillus aviarius]
MVKNKKKLLKHTINNERKAIFQQFIAKSAFQSSGYTSSHNNRFKFINTANKMTDQLLYFRHNDINNIINKLINNINDEEKLGSLLKKYIHVNKKVVSSPKNTIYIKKGTDFYRAVSNPDYTSKPPVDITPIGRLNCKKEPILYLAFSPETAYSEVKKDYILHFVAKKDFKVMLSYFPTLDETFKNSAEQELEAYKSELCNRIFSLTPSKTNNRLSNEQIYCLTNKLKDLIRDPLISALIYPSTKFENNLPLSKKYTSSKLLDCVIFENDEELVTCIKKDTYKYKEK